MRDGLCGLGVEMKSAGLGAAMALGLCAWTEGRPAAVGGIPEPAGGMGATLRPRRGVEA